MSSSTNIRFLRTELLHGVQRNFLGQTAVSLCKGFLTFRTLTPFQSSGRAGGLVAPDLLVVSFGATKPLAHTADGEAVSARSGNFTS
jgi:hypothetical protein